MDYFSYLSVLISIVLGLGITNLLMGIARIIQMRTRVVIYWPTMVWMLTLLLIHIQTWWTMFGLRQIEHWTFVGFTVTLMQPIMLFLLSALVLPDFDRDEAPDLKRNYYAQRRWFFGFFIALLGVSIARNFTLSGRVQQGTDLAFHLLFFVGALAAMIFPSEFVHKLAALSVSTLFVSYVMILFATLH